jgi:putative tryptophan/tyrosine transport system substrate-binding protein
VNRRSIITLLGGAAAAWPILARAQQQAVPVIGFLHTGSPREMAPLAAAFRQGLSETGYAEGHNVAIDHRWAEGQYERLPALLADLVQRPVAVIAATGGTVQAAKAATTTIPIVFTTADDPVREGLIASISRPGGNMTGVSLYTTTLDAKRLGLLHELVPHAGAVAVLANPKYYLVDGQLRELEAAARRVGLRLNVLNASTEGEIGAAFASLVRQRAEALLVLAEPFLTSRRHQIATLAVRHGVPAIYPWREFAVAGGLLSYGASITDSFRQVGSYAGQILKGAKPGELPVLQPAKFELVINLQVAKALGVEVPPMLLARADEVIE